MYQALYRKWRPRTFDDVVGQEHVTETLKRQIETGRLSHAYLFTGTRGTGKTTCAKLLARAVNCERPQGGSPCNQCPSCMGIEDGSILDVLELDAASNNRVDDIRAILDEAVYTPAAVKKRVYIVDEVHMLSAQAFNALLQILEEPPEHLLFILATTEIHKVPATIKSRCQQFSFKRIRPKEIARRLLYVAGQEGIGLTQDGAALIARLSDGGMRDALSLLDQCAGAGETVDEARVYDTLGLAGNLETAALLEDIAEENAASALERLAKLYNGGREMSALVGEMACLTRDLLVRHVAPRAGASLMTGGFDEATLKRLEPRFSIPRLVQMLNLLQDTAASLKNSANRRTDVELCLAVLCDPALDQTPAGLNARLSRLEQGGGSAVPAAAEKPPAGATEPLETVVPPVHGAGTRPAPPAPDLPPWETADAPAKAAQPVPARAAEPAAKAEAGPPEERPDGGAAPARADEAPVRQTVSWPGWEALRQALKSEMDIVDYSFLGNPDMVEGRLEGEVLTLWASMKIVKDMIDKKAVLDVVARKASQMAGRSLRVAVKEGKAPEESPVPQSPPPAEEDALEALLAQGLDNLIVE